MTTNNRTQQRARLLLAAALQDGRSSAGVKIRDLSATGAQLDGRKLPATGSAVSLSRAGLSATGEVVWVKDGRCGIRFDAPIAIEEWAPVRRLEAVTVRPEAKERTGPPSLNPRIADELAFVARMLESLGDELANDRLLLARHGTKLQDIDIAVQILGHLGRVLYSDRPEDVVLHIGMESLRRRLQRRPL